LLAQVCSTPMPIANHLFIQFSLRPLSCRSVFRARAPWSPVPNSLHSPPLSFPPAVFAPVNFPGFSLMDPGERLPLFAQNFFLSLLFRLPLFWELPVRQLAVCVRNDRNDLFFTSQEPYLLTLIRPRTVSVLLGPFSLTAMLRDLLSTSLSFFPPPPLVCILRPLTCGKISEHFYSSFVSRRASFST